VNRILDLVLISVVATLILALSAQGQCNPEHDDISNLLGTWTWVHTWSPLEPATTPESTGSTAGLVFRSDGTYTRLRNAVVLDGGAWCVRPCENADPALCHGQSVLYLEGGPETAGWTMELDYWFCPSAVCAPTGVAFERAVQLSGLALDAGIDTYEYAGGVATNHSSWGAVKGSYR